jgi:arylsulfatase A-like enzyme
MNVGDKPSWVRQTSMLNERAIEKCDELQRWRLRSMRAVEDEIDAVIQALAQTGRIENTYIFYVSDNGLLMGQHRAVGKKNNPYEESARVPFQVRGPGVPAVTVDQLVLNIDIAPTVLELAGLAIPDTVDGRSLVPFLRGSQAAGWRKEVLIEAFTNGPTYGLRSADWLYVHNETEELELYDMKADPWQTESLHRKVDAAILASHEQRVVALSGCRGISCRN